MFDNINSAEIHQNHTDNTDDKTAPHLCDDGRIMTCVITRNVKYHQNMTLGPRQIWAFHGFVIVQLVGAGWNKILNYKSESVTDMSS